MVTIYDVAKRAKVSISTVSRVLNGSEHVREETRQRVEQAMRELDYVPNPSARSLSLGTAHIIALVVPDISNSFYSELTRGVQDVCNARGYNVLIYSTDGDKDKEASCLEGLAKQQIDGICLVRHLVDESNIDLVAKWGVPVVLIGSQARTQNMDSVGTFGTGTALREILSGLVAHGRHRLGHIAGPSTSIVGAVRLKQYQAAVKEFKLDRDNQLVAVGDFTREGGRTAAAKLLSLDVPPDALFAANDMMAVGALQAAEEAGISVPKDVAIFGCDDIDIAALLRPSLTSVWLPKYDLGKQAAELLFSRLAEPDAPIRHVSLQAKPVHRESTFLGTSTIEPPGKEDEAL